MVNIRYTEASTKSGPVTRCQIIIQNGWLHWLVTRYGDFFQAEELNPDLGQRKGFPFGNVGVLCLPDTITSCVLVGTLTKTKIRVAFSHPSAFPWGGGTRARKAEWYYCHRICAKDACNTITQISCHRTTNDEETVPS